MVCRVPEFISSRWLLLLIDAVEPRGLQFARGVVFHLAKRDCPGRANRRRRGPVESRSRGFAGGFEVGICLARVADDDVGCDARGMSSRTSRISTYRRGIAASHVRAIVAPVHGRESNHTLAARRLRGSGASFLRVRSQERMVRGARSLKVRASGRRGWLSERSCRRPRRLPQRTSSTTFAER